MQKRLVVGHGSKKGIDYHVPSISHHNPKIVGNSSQKGHQTRKTMSFWTMLKNYQQLS
jgi:hypothetical protein